MGHEYGSFQSFFMVFFHGIFTAFSWLKTKKKPWDLPWKYFEKPVKMLWIYMKNLTGISCALILKCLLARILIALSLPFPPYLCYWTGSWGPGCLAWGLMDGLWGLFAMETVQWNLYSGRTPLGLRQGSPEWRLGWGLLIINQQIKYYYFSWKRHLLL